MRPVFSSNLNQIFYEYLASDILFTSSQIIEETEGMKQRDSWCSYLNDTDIIRSWVALIRQEVAVLKCLFYGIRKLSDDLVKDSFLIVAPLNLPKEFDELTDLELAIVILTDSLSKGGEDTLI